MKKQIIILYGPQGGGKTTFLNRMRKYCFSQKLSFLFFDEIISVEDIDEILLNNENWNIVIATQLSCDSLFSAFKGCDISMIECDYHRGFVPALYPILKNRR